MQTGKDDTRSVRTLFYGRLEANMPLFLVVGEDFAPLFMHLKEKNGQKMKHMEKMWKIQGIPYIGLNFTSIGSRIYRQIGTSLILV